MFKITGVASQEFKALTFGPGEAAFKLPRRPQPAPHAETLCRKLVPDLKGRPGVEFCLADLMKVALTGDPQFQRNSAAAVAQLVKTFEQSRGAGFSWGGWMENRETVFRGTYMDKDRRYIHLGVDINAPAGAPVYFPAKALVLAVNTFNDTEVGWGTRVDLRHPALPLVFMVGHLAPQLFVSPGLELSAEGQLIGHIGSAAVNGNVFPHIHIQAMELTQYYLQKENGEPDGYGECDRIKDLPVLYPDPLYVLECFARSPLAAPDAGGPRGRR